MYYNNKRLALSIFWIALGAVLAVLSLTGIIDGDYFVTMGIAFAAVGALQLYKNLKYRRDKDFREKTDIEFTDERNLYIRQKAWSWTGYLMVLISAVGSLIAFLIGRSDIMQFLMSGLCVIVCLYWITYVIISRRN